MSIKLSEDLKPGDLFISDTDEVYKIKSICLSPSVTMENVVTGSTIGGGVECLNLNPFDPVSDLNRDDIVLLMKQLVSELELKNSELMSCKEKLIAIKEEYIQLKEEIITRTVQGF